MKVKMSKQEELEMESSVRWEEDNLCTRVETAYKNGELVGWKFVCENPVAYDPSGCSVCESCQRKELEDEAWAESQAAAREEASAHGSSKDE